MKTRSNSMQAKPGLTGHPKFRLNRAATLGLAGIISTLFTGCAYNSEMTNAAMPVIKPIYITHGSETAASYYTLGKYYFWQNRFDKAQEAFQHALLLQPSNVDALNGLGSVYDRLGQFESAQRAYRLALGKAPEASYIWANLGYSLMMQGRPVTAAALLEKAVKLDPANKMARRNLALATEEASKLAARSPGIKQDLPVVASTVQPSEKPAAVETASKTTILAEESKPAEKSKGDSIITVIPHESVQYSAVIKAVVAVRNTSPVSIQPNPTMALTEDTHAAPIVKAEVAQTEETAPSIIADVTSMSKADAAPVVVAAASVQADEVYPPHWSYPTPAPIENAVPDFGKTRIEISNGNGVNGMARALRANLKPEGVNVTRVTNDRPFNKSRTVIICSNEMKETARELARLIPGNPNITIGSTAYRNVEIRVVLGADAALAWNNNNKFIVAALGN